MRPLLGYSTLLWLICGTACRGADSPPPEPAQKWGVPAALATPATPAPPAPFPPVHLTDSEKAAVEQLRRRGAHIDVAHYSEAFTVDFPWGARERRWLKAGEQHAFCGQGIAYSFSPDGDGPPMTDADLVYLEQLPRLRVLRIAGTGVSRKAINAFRAGHPEVEVDETARN
jgi:hypothetical protein